MGVTVQSHHHHRFIFSKMDLLDTKILTLFLLLVVTFVIGVATLPLRKVLGLQSVAGGARQLVTSFLLYFGGGVMIYVCMLHILPEISEQLEGTGPAYLPQLLVCCGFFLIYLIEELVEFVLARCRSQDPVHKDGGLQGASEEQAAKPAKSIKLKDFFTILALSLHSLFEGLAIGLEESIDDVWTFFIAIASHKFVVSFCVSLEMQQSGTRLPMFLTYLSVFSLMSPLGEAIGIVLTESGGSGVDDAIIASLQGLAAGTLLYVAMFEILSRERANQVSGLLQLLGICTGFAAMIGIESVASEPEEDKSGALRLCRSALASLHSGLVTIAS